MAHLRAVPSEPDDDPVVAAPLDPVADPATDQTAADVDGEPVPEPVPEDEPRTYPSTIGGAFYLSILGVSCVAIAIAARSDWRLGIQILGGALVMGALLRLMLNRRDAGMLAVRNRFLDAFLLGAAGAALVVLATSIPNMPT